MAKQSANNMFTTIKKALRQQPKIERVLYMPRSPR